MLIIRTAFKNILGGGKRTWLNVAVLSFALVIMVALNGIMDGWVEESHRDTCQWETGAGQIWHPAYDRYDVFTLQDAHGPVPSSFIEDIRKGLFAPVLVVQATLYPKGRMQNIQLKGIDSGQGILKIPSEKLVAGEGEIPVILGTRMAIAADLNEGDRVMLRWRDKNGVFDAREVFVSHIFDSKVPAVDSGQLWMKLDDLRKLTGMYGEATYLVMAEDVTITADLQGWVYKDLGFLMSDIDLMIQNNRIESFVIFAILLAIALLAVFDTQTLSIFRRQKEIGTYIALGMMPRTVVGLFTLEGTAYSVFAVLAGVVWGTPLLYLFAKTGMPLPDSYSDLGIVVGNAAYPVYLFSSILITIIVVVSLSAVISFLPARKIARQNVVLALKGKTN